MGSGLRDYHHNNHDRRQRDDYRFTPGSTIVLKETSGPRHYRFGKSVTYVTRSGKVAG